MAADVNKAKKPVFKVRCYLLVIYFAGLSILEEKELKGVESTYILSGLHLVVIIAVSPVEVVEIT